MLIRLEATTAQLRQEMAKADTTVAQVAGRIDNQLGRVDSAFDRAGASAEAAASALKGAISSVVGTAGISQLLQHAEAYTTIANRLKLVTTNAAEFQAAQRAVFDIAQRSGQPLTATAELYQRIATNQKELKLTGQGVAGIVETISKTMVISGASTESANAALIQLGQAFASGTLRGEELNSVLEQAPALAQAIAKGMGVSVGALRSLGAAGKLTADSVVKALQAQAAAVNELYGKMQTTVSQGLTKLDNSATQLIGKLDQTSGVSQKLAGVLTSVSKSLDSVSADGSSLAYTVERVTSVAEKLAIVIGARLALSAGQSAIAFASATKASIDQAIALGRSAVASDAARVADAASAQQALLTAQSRQVDAKAMLERASVELATAEQKVAADRVRQASEVANLQAVQTAIVAERGLEEQRLRAQITDTGRAQSIARIVELRQSEIAITNQVRAAETALAETSVATSAQIQAAYQRRSAAAGAYGETTLAVNEAVAASEKTTAAASSVSRGIAGLSAAGGGLLALLTGPVGMIATVALVAASFIDFGGSAKTATAALIDQNLTVDDSIAKFKELGAAQRTLQVSTWTEKQVEALDSAGAALNEYSLRGMEAFQQLGVAGEEGAEAFGRMVEKVRAGTLPLNSVTEWVKENKALLPTYTALLEQSAAAYEINGLKADKYGKLLGQVNNVTAAATTATGQLAASQQNSGQTDASKVAWDKYIDQLTKTRDLLGANAAAEAAYTAAKMGATPAQAAQAKIIADQTDTLKKYQDAIKDSSEAEKVRLKAQLVALYTAEDAANEAAAAQKKALDDTAKAAEESAARQVNAMQLVINQAVNLTKGRNLLLLPETKPDTKNQTGYGLLTNGGTAPVAPVKPKATPDQRAETAIAQLDATTEANKRVDKAANAAATALKNQQKALEDLLAKSGIATKASNDIADAYLAGANNVRELTIKQEIETEVLKTGAKAYDRVAAAVNAMHDAKDRAEVMKHVAELRVEIESLQKEAVATLQGQEAIDAFNVAKSVQAELIDKKIAVGSAEYDQLVAVTKAQLESNKALEQANAANGIVDRLYPQTKLLRDYTQEQEALNKAIELYPEKADAYRDALQRLGVEYQQNKNAATSWGHFTEGAIDRIDDAFADMWKSVLSKSGNFMDTLKDSFRQFLAEMLHMAITKPILVQFASALGVGGAQAQSSELFGDLTGGGGGGLTSWLGTAKNVLSVASSNFGQSLMAGWNAGEGIVGGLEGALSNGASYVGNAITSAFASGSATASNAAASLAAGSTQAGYTGAQFGSYVSSANAASSLSALSTTLSYVGAVYAVIQSYQAYGAKGAATTAGFAAAGAAIGTWVFPVVGTALGAAIGAVVGSIASSKLFSSGEKYPDLSTSATGNYVNGKYTDTGIATTWQRKAPKYGAAADNAMSSTLNKFSSTLGNLYEALGNGADVVAYSTLQQRKTSGKYSSTFGAQLDDGSVITGKQQFKADDIAAALTADYDDIMGTFLAKAIVSSKSLPEYFKSQFTAFASDWNTTADQVIKAIEGVFTRFNGVNDALSLINVANLKLDNTGLIASDSILNMIGAIADLDTTTATAKEKVDALNKSVGTYYQAFFSADEQFADLTKSLQGAFAGFGLNLPDTRSAYRNMVEDIDVTTTAGQAMFATMMGLATNADAYYTQIDKQAQAAVDAANEAAQAAASAWSNYYGLFATDTQKAGDALMRATQEFRALGLGLPASRSDFAEMVNAIDQTTVAGKSLFNSLLGLATDADAAFDVMEASAASATQAAQDAAKAQADATESAAQAIKDALSLAVNNSFAAVQRAISAQQKAAEAAYNATNASISDMLDTANSLVSDLTGVSNDLGSALKSLRGDSESAVQMLRRQAQATLQNALATARAGGSLANFAGLGDALTAVSSNSTGLYSSLEEFNRDQGRTANVVAELNTLNGKQLTNAEKSAAALQAQLDQAKKAYDAQVAQFDSQLAFAQSQLDALNGVDTTVQSVTDAVDRMNADVVRALAGQAAGAGAGNTYNNNAALVESVYQRVLGRTAEAGGVSFWSSLLANGSVTYAGLVDAIAQGGKANGETVKIPGYAAGGSFGGGLRLVGENGPELEVTGPSRIFDSRTTAAMLNGGGSDAAVVAELRALRGELEMIKANTQASAVNVSKVARTLDRVTDGGNAMLTKELA
jgi:tape measure domain-containing protein